MCVHNHNCTHTHTHTLDTRKVCHPASEPTYGKTGIHSLKRAYVCTCKLKLELIAGVCVCVCIKGKTVKRSAHTAFQWLYDTLCSSSKKSCMHPTRWIIWTCEVNFCLLLISRGHLSFCTFEDSFVWNYVVRMCDFYRFQHKCNRLAMNSISKCYSDPKRFINSLNEFGFFSFF